MTLLRRIAPALALLLIAPLIAEFLLGDFNIRQIGFILVFIPVYGAGALLVREITRRARRGWPTMILLALAYALVMEGFTNQTLFNPNYAGQRLLDYGFISALGTSFHFSLYVLTLHVVWSIGSSIALAEGLAGARWAEPWLGGPGLLVSVILTLLGCGFTTIFTLRTFHFVATIAQFIAVAVAVVLLIVLAFLAFRPLPQPEYQNSESPNRSFWLVIAAALILSSGFQFWFVYAPRNGVSPSWALAGLLGLDMTAVMLFAGWSRQAGWGPNQALAAGTGAVLTYGGLSLRRYLVAGGTALGVPTTPIDVAGQVVLLLLLLALSQVGRRRLRPA